MEWVIIWPADTGMMTTVLRWFLSVMVTAIYFNMQKKPIPGESKSFAQMVKDSVMIL